MRFDWQTTFAALLQRLDAQGQTAWAATLRRQLQERFEERPHGDLARWMSALASLPAPVKAQVQVDRDTVQVDGVLTAEEQARVEPALRGLMPWRKGPFVLFGVAIDTEWRSDWKWARIAPHLSPLAGRRVLDVGCGSGYHVWRMWGAGAAEVIGIDPSLLFLMQFQAIKRQIPDAPADLLPLRMEDLPAGLGYFDTTFSMGVLYHRRSPIDHLLELRDTLRPGGELVLETLVVEGPLGYSLMPEDRYAMMRNVWFIPSVPTLELWLRRAGFKDIRTVDVSVTTREEQRATDWMRFQSLQDFLDPQDPTRTVEGYPAPLRAAVVARVG